MSTPTFHLEYPEENEAPFETSCMLPNVDETELCLTDEDEYVTMILNAMHIFKEMRDTGLACDGLLKTEGGGEIPVHRSIMTTCSPYFKALFIDSLGEGKSRSEIFIPGVTYEMLWHLVHYTYTFQPCISEENVKHLFVVADQFNVVDMLSDCINFVLSGMTASNCISIRKFAQAYFCQELEEKAYKDFFFRYITMNFKIIAEESEELMMLDLSDVIEIFSSEDLNVSNEKVAWEAIVKWIDKDPENRKNHIVELMRCVRLGLLETTYFMEQVKMHPYVICNEGCKPSVIETMRFMYDLQEITTRTEEVITPKIAQPRYPHEIMFVVGGWSGGSPTNVIEAYDTRADRWIFVHTVDPAGPRAYHKCVVIGYDMYVVGGFNGNMYFNSCRVFNAYEKTWREIAPMHSPRCYVSASAENNMLYAMGGYDGHNRQNTAEKYDSRTNQWSLIAPMNAQRSDACAATLNGVIYIVGGFNGTECLNSCECYDPESNTWTNIAQMRSRRSGVSCVAHGDHVFALGGFNGISRLQTGEKYNPITDQWTSIPDMFNQRSNFAMEVIDDMIFAVGGFNGITTIYHVECYCPINNEWLEATDMNTFRSALCACVIKGLPNVRDYVHKNRDRLMEEKRLKLLQIQESEQREGRFRFGGQEDDAREGDDENTDDEENDVEEVAI